MESTRKQHGEANSCIERDMPFDSSKYNFRGVASKTNELTKTFIRRKFTPGELHILTKLYHKNVISLKKIAKSKRNAQEDLFWLYYETIPYSLDMVLSRFQFDVRPETLEAALTDLNRYLTSQNIHFAFNSSNIGVNENGVIKVYLPIDGILRSLEQGIKLRCEGERKIKEIKIWYSRLYSRRSIKPSLTPQAANQKRSHTKLNRLMEIKCDFERLRKNIKSEESKNNSQIQAPKKEEKKLKMVSPLEPHSSTTINIYDRSHQHQFNKLAFNQKNKEKIRLPPKEVVKNYDYDGESVDTYQMELGEDFEMPSIRTNQKLRQTVLNSQKSWDTLTHRNPTNASKKIHESAGTKGFSILIENSKKSLRQGIKQSMNNEDTKTVQESSTKRDWQTQTIKSALPPNIQDRVQQALAKTKTVMQMLKNTKSFSASK